MFGAALGAFAALGMRASMTQVQPVAEDVLDIKQVWSFAMQICQAERASCAGAVFHSTSPHLASSAGDSPPSRSPLAPQEYEGGYVLIAVEHADSPALDWHRDDLMH